MILRQLQDHTAREVNSLADITDDGQYTPTPVVANSSDTGNGGISSVL